MLEPSRMEPSPHTASAATGAGCGHEHLVEFYETTAFLVGTVADFLVPALRAGDAGVVVATQEHRAAFAAAIRAEGVDLERAMAEGRYQEFDAAQLLSTFMVDGTPDEALFASAIGAVLDLASAAGRSVKVYGEMVALLWADGDVGSTITVEDLWNDLASSRSFALLCAYPMQGFDDDARAAFKQICTQHSAVISTDRDPGSSLAEHRRLVAGLQAEAATLRAELQRLRTHLEDGR